MNLRKEELEKLKQETDEELIAIMCDYHEEKRHLAKFIYENRCREREHEFNKAQIELQHQRNTELMNRQVKWIRFSAILTAIATLSAVVLGWYLSELKQERISRQSIQQTSQQQTISSTISTLPSTIPIVPTKEKGEQKLKK
jgi:hypothetical protein